MSQIEPIKMRTVSMAWLSHNDASMATVLFDDNSEA